METEQRQRFDRIASIANAIVYHNTIRLAIPPRSANAVDIENAVAALEKRIEMMKEELANG